ncbi:unnamed protein product [Pleuronectes platessa]|uniref:Uncharacterized protein n=1 Tax=Pleuronectes platessa TaxID=8262 RepID=A0A9N7TXW6_PLEPL|nr:unnamed protein product [Pleuronectes platessa]
MEQASGCRAGWMNRHQAAEQGEWHRPQKQCTMDEADPKAVYKKLLYAAVSTNLKPNHSSTRQKVNHTSQFLRSSEQATATASNSVHNQKEQAEAYKAEQPSKADNNMNNPQTFES